MILGIEGPASDPVRTSNSLTLKLDTTAGNQLLPLPGGEGTYVFPETYSSTVFLELKVLKQPDEYYCHRTDATLATTAATTLLHVRCDYLGPEYYHMQWNYEQAKLRGGGLEMYVDASPPILYGLWTSVRVSQDDRAEIGLAQDGMGDLYATESDPGALILTLPSRPITGTVLVLQPTAFALGAQVPVNQATILYVNGNGTKSYAVGSVVVTGFGIEVVSRAAGVGSIALEFVVDATLETDFGLAQLQGTLLLSATNDPARGPGSFRTQDGTHCIFDAGQTIAIDPSGIRCHDTISEADYYQPVYAVAAACIENSASITQGTTFCVRSQDDHCQGQYPRCE